jgi:predicted transposase YbfD/YdcC
MSEREALGAQGAWSNVHRVGMVEARRAVGDTVQGETRDWLTSLSAQGVRCAQAVRPPWGIENALHWVRDGSGEEEACRMRKDKGAQPCAVLRHLAVNRLRREPHHKRGRKARRKRAGWDRDSLVQVLTG